MTSARQMGSESTWNAVSRRHNRIKEEHRRLSEGWAISALTSVTQIRYGTGTVPMGSGPLGSGHWALGPLPCS